MAEQPVLSTMSTRPGYSFHASQSPLFERRSPERVLTISRAAAAMAVRQDAVARRILAKRVTVEEGDRIGARLNSNVLKSTGVAVNTLHRGSKGDGYTRNKGWWGGEVVAYAQVVTLRNAFLNVHQVERERIATGQTGKGPMASVDGEFVATNLPSFDGVEVRFNPKRDTLFRDRDGCAVRRADEATVVGHSVFLRGVIEYYGEEDVPARAGDSPNECVLYVPPSACTRRAA